MILGTDMAWSVGWDIHNEWNCSVVIVEQHLQIITTFLKQWEHFFASIKFPPQFLHDSSGNFFSKLLNKN